MGIGTGEASRERRTDLLGKAESRLRRLSSFGEDAVPLFTWHGHEFQCMSLFLSIIAGKIEHGMDPNPSYKDITERITMEDGYGQLAD